MTETATARQEAPPERVSLEPSQDFVLTEHIEDMTARAMTYLEIGMAVHFAGPAGAGKTTLAFHLAARLGRPVVLMHGDDEFGSSDLVGRDTGFRRSKVVDNYISSVLRTEERVNSVWMENRLTTACQLGYTLIYDEFTRSRPEANNPLLTVLEERILNVPGMRRGGEGYLAVHPEFRAIFTSNPDEYAGVHRGQDALLDRMVTMQVGHFDRDTEVQIVASKTGLALEQTGYVVDLVRALRGASEAGNLPSIRAAFSIARVLVHRGASASPDDATFRWVCRDVLGSSISKLTPQGHSLPTSVVDDVVSRLYREATEHVTH
ncbi:MAG: gas vesicle protein GvpN [Acidobacteria bacterium]|nr:gas vesicle protein GvpN [Acidobacteriota bacterium]